MPNYFFLEFLNIFQFRIEIKLIRIRERERERSVSFGFSYLRSFKIFFSPLIHFHSGNLNCRFNPFRWFGFEWSVSVFLFFVTFSISLNRVWYLFLCGIIDIFFDIFLNGIHSVSFGIALTNFMFKIIFISFGKIRRRNTYTHTLYHYFNGTSRIMMFVNDSFAYDRLPFVQSNKSTVYKWTNETNGEDNWTLEKLQLD